MTTLTTGPFIIPSVMLNGQPVDNLVVQLKNETNSRKTVTVIVHRCPHSEFPAKSTETIIANQIISLNPNQCTTFLLPSAGHFNIFDTLKVTLTGDVQTVNRKHNQEGIEAWIVTGRDGGPFEPTNLFRHNDLFEPEGKHHDHNHRRK